MKKRPRDSAPASNNGRYASNSDRQVMDERGQHVVRRGYRGGLVGFHSRASFCASAICAGVISPAATSRFFTAF